jgi:FMN phosphatase YigB (HAD superfamily)
MDGLTSAGSRARLMRQPLDCERESPNLKSALQLVLFDLDDTLFDHQHSRRCGLLALQHTYLSLAQIPLKTLVAEHERQLTARPRAGWHRVIADKSPGTVPAHIYSLWH